MNLLQSVDDRWVHAMEARAVQISAPSQDQLQFDAVEVGPLHSKPRTNVLLHRRLGPQGWEFFVDDDLAYLGGDEARRKLFTGPRFQHWQELMVPRPVQGDVHEAMLQLLHWLDSPMRERLPIPPRSGMAGIVPPTLGPHLQDVARLAGLDELVPDGFRPTPAQAEAIARVAAAIMQPVSPCCPLIHGPSGGGKHFLVRGAAVELIARGHFDQALEVSGTAVAAGMIFRAQKDERLYSVLDAAFDRKGTLVLLDEFDAAFEQSDIAAGLIARHLDRGLKMIAIARGEFEFSRVETLAPLYRRLHMVYVPPMSPAETIEILNRRLLHHPLVGKVEVATGLVPSIVRAADRLPGANPGAAIQLLDALLSQAAWLNAGVVGLDDLLHFLPPSEECDV